MDNCEPMYPTPDVPFNWHVVNLNTKRWKEVIMRGGEENVTDYTLEEDEEFEQFIAAHEMWFSDIEAPDDHCGGAHSVRYYFTAHLYGSDEPIVVMDNMRGMPAGLVYSIEDAKEAAVAHLGIMSGFKDFLKSRESSKWN